MMEVPTLAIRKTSTMFHATFTAPDLTAFCLLDDHGLTVTGQEISPDKAILECRVTDRDPFCRGCGAEGVARGTQARRLAHVPLGWRPTTLLVRVRRFACSSCGTIWREDTTAAAEPRGKLTRAAIRWAIEAVVCQHLPVARVAESLDVSWHAANDAVLAEGQRLLIDDPARFDGVTTIGVDEHVWRHTRLGDKYVTVIIDLTPARDKTGPARLLDMVPGRSKQAFKTWLAGRPKAWRDGVDVVAMDGFSGYKTAAGEEIPDATTVMDPFHVVALFGDALDKTRQRVQQETLGHRGRTGDPLYGCRRLLRTGLGLLKQHHLAKLEDVFDRHPEHLAVEVTWDIYPRVVAAYRHKDPSRGKKIFERVIAMLSSEVPRDLPELISLGRTIARRAGDILAFFDHPGTSNGPSEAINGRLEHLRGTALGFRNLAHYIARSLLEAGGFRPRLHPQTR